MKKQLPAKLKPFLFHGVDLDLAAGQKEAEADCPFCDKEQHFFINKTTGQWDCKVCGESGNVYGFLNVLHRMSVETTKAEDFEALAEDRFVPVEAFKAWGVAKNPLNDEWLIPAFNDKGKLANLSKWDGGRPFGTPGLKIWPFGLHLLKKGQDTLWVAEGPWDGMALWSALRCVRSSRGKLIKTANAKKALGASQAVIAVPGAQNFKQDWLAFFTGKTVRLAYDNDHPRKSTGGKTVRPGWDGMTRVAKLCGGMDNGEAPERLERLYWGKKGHSTELEDGFDVRDLFRDKGPVRCLDFLLANSKRVKLSLTGKKLSPEKPEGPQYEPIERTSFKELVRDFEAVLHFTPILKDTLATMLAVMVSTELPGEQLWLRCIGPPGSGKTTLAECLSVARDYVFPVSTITGLHSGYTEGRGKKARAIDASLVKKMNMKTTFIKDGDTLLNAQNRDKILAELRDLYDGTSRAEYRNLVSHDYDSLRMTFVLCATDEIRSLNRTHLGERFLDCEILGEEDQTPYLDAAFNNTLNAILGYLEDRSTEDKFTTLKRASLGFVVHLKQELLPSSRPIVPPEVKDKIEAMGQVISYCRAQVKRERGEVQYRPRIELGTRLTSQLTKLAMCLAITLQKKKVDAECLRLLRKIAIDTAFGFQFEIVRLLIRHKTGLSSKQIALTLSLGKSTVERYTQDMLELEMLNRDERPNRSGVRGRRLHIFTLAPMLRKLWLKAGFRTK
jgi:ribosomal protein L37AE/L43A